MQTELKQSSTTEFSLEEQLLHARKNNLIHSDSIEHRLEFVAKINGVEYVNDSKATDVSATWYSLEYMNKPVIWIMYASDMETDYSIFNEIVAEKVKAIICIGKNCKVIEKSLKKFTPLFITTETLNDAVIRSKSLAENDNIVLFSPACASFDLYKNYRERGKHFREIVNSLK